jgi:penicillin-insensitive murein endopeptidase
MAALEIPVQDSRRYFILPQSPEESGYYTYGLPKDGVGQYTHPALINALFAVERHWSLMDERKFGIGNISLYDGKKFSGHDSHRSGLDVDIRPIRRDGKQLGVTRFDANYDRDATARLIELFFCLARVKLVYFNDISIPGVRSLAGHDNHFHVTIKAPR